MPSVREVAAKIKLRGRLSLDEPMHAHTSFRLGGPADLYLVPADAGELACSIAELAAAAVPAFLLGGGTNLLVADRGIRGAVIDLTGLAGIAIDGDEIEAAAGTTIDAVVEAALASGLSGLEFAASLPGTVGGAVWMNARCYEREAADVLAWVESLGPDGRVHRRTIAPREWGYKRSPYQASGEAILRARFRLTHGDRRRIAEQMADHREDRRRKGHFRHPCAGSVFKNDRSFGAPTGRIIDELGLKGLRVGGAQVAPFHGNIIVNLGEATAADVRALIERVEAEVFARRGLPLEREVILVGEW